MKFRYALTNKLYPIAGSCLPSSKDKATKTRRAKNKKAKLSRRKNR